MFKFIEVYIQKMNPAATPGVTFIIMGYSVEKWKQNKGLLLTFLGGWSIDIKVNKKLSEVFMVPESEIKKSRFFPISCPLQIKRGFCVY